MWVGWGGEVSYLDGSFLSKYVLDPFPKPFKQLIHFISYLLWKGTLFEARKKTNRQANKYKDKQKHPTQPPVLKKKPTWPLPLLKNYLKYQEQVTHVVAIYSYVLLLTIRKCTNPTITSVGIYKTKAGTYSIGRGGGYPAATPPHPAPSLFLVVNIFLKFIY